MRAREREGLDLVICGVGGQGNVLASRIVADALMERGEHVKCAETIGMAQRGGSVASHVRGGRPQSPLVPRGTADVLVAFEPGEALRCIDYLKPLGTVVVNTKASRPPSAALQRVDYDGREALAWLERHAREEGKSYLVEVDAAAACAQVGTPKVANVAMLAAATSAGVLGISREELEAAVKRRVKERFWDVNLAAISLFFE